MASQVVLQFSTTRFQAYQHPGPGASRLQLWHWRLASAPIAWRNKSSWVIRKLAHSPFSHVDFVMSDGTLLGASDMGEGSPIVSGNPCGVAVRPWNYQQFGYRRQMILDTPKADDIYNQAYSQLHKPFDNGGLRNFLSSDFPNVRDWRDPAWWWCSELGAWSEETGGYWDHPLSWPKNRVSPTDLVLAHVTDPRFVNRETFWEPIPGLVRDPWET